MRQRLAVANCARAIVSGMLLAAPILGCPGEVPQASVDRLIILTNGTSPFWDAAAAGARDASAAFNLDAAGLRVVVDRGDFTVETQLEKLKQYASSTDVVGVAISVTDENNRAIVDEMQRLQQAGIHVITVDSDLDRAASRDARFAYIGTDNNVAGRELGKAAARVLPEGGQYAAFVGLKGATNARERIGGFAEAAGEFFEQVEVFGDGGAAEVARKNVRDALDRNPDLNMLVGIWSYNTPAIVDIVKELGVREQVKVVGFDADPPSIGGMQNGFVDVLLVQNPYQMGYQGVRLLKALVEDDRAAIDEILPDYGSAAGDLYDTGLKVVVPNDGSPLGQEMFQPNTQFLTLEEFQSWLQEHGLTGS